MKNIADQAENCNGDLTASTQNNTAFVESAIVESILNSGQEEEKGKQLHAADKCNAKSENKIAAVEPHSSISKTSIVGKGLWARY